MPTAPSFRKRVDHALESKDLATALDRALPSRRKVREAVLPPRDFQPLRQDLQARKRDAIDRLPDLISQFTEEAERVGANVHLAQTIEDAQAIIGELAHRHGVKLVVKGKSMASEEIEVNEYLEQKGIKVVETDLGEWIVQLAHEKPSHLITPALHKTREQVAELFSRHVGRPIPADIPELVKVARSELRNSFIDADMGITGANVAIADTGTLVIVSNEGNGRLVSTLPPVHVAILGVEKIVPTLDDASAVLKVLSKSATGQKMTSYVSFITGPSRTADIELSLTIGVHGPGELHIVLLDNGRTAMRERPEYRDALNCIRCSACLNECPPFQAVGGHVFGHKYTGPIGLVLTAFHHGYENAEGPQSLCVGCNACETVCPSGIDIPRMILDLRQEMHEQKPVGGLKKRVLDWLTYRSTSKRLVGLARAAQGPFSGDRGLLRLPGFTGWRSLPKLPGRTFLDTFSPGEELPPTPVVKCGASGSRIMYFPGCMTDSLFPEMGEKAVQSLRDLGAAVTIPERKQCCGLAHMNAGDRSTAVEMAKQTITLMETSEDIYVVSTSASCVVAMVRDYPHLLRDEPEWAERARAGAGKVMDFVSFVDKVAALGPGDLAAGSPPHVTCHDSCQSANCLGLGAEQRKLVQETMGGKVVEMDEPSACCGFGGTFSLEYPRVSARIMEHKLEHIQETGSDTVITDNPGCIMQLRGGLDAAGSDVRVLHVAELVADQLELIKRRA